MQCKEQFQNETQKSRCQGDRLAVQLNLFQVTQSVPLSFTGPARFAGDGIFLHFLSLVLVFICR